MTTRERTLSTLIVGFIVVVGGGFVGYTFIYKPLQDKEAKITTLKEQVDGKLNDLVAFQKRKPDLERWKRMSLPADVEFASLKYYETLKDLVRRSGFDQNTMAVAPEGAPDAKNVPQFASKKPIYTKISFLVNVHGDMGALIDWLDRFYKTPLMHQIHDISITKPTTTSAAGGGRGGRGGGPNQAQSNNLAITMNIDAIVINDLAEKRDKLLPDKTDDLPPPLAENRSYAQMAGKDLFYGMSPTSRPGDTPRGPDVTPYVKLTSITGTGDNVKATLYDAYHGHDFVITPHTIDGYRVESTYMLNGQKRNLPNRNNREISMVDDMTSEVTHRWRVAKIGENEIFLHDEFSGKYVELRAGRALNAVVEVKEPELSRLGIKLVEPAKPDGGGNNGTPDK